MIKTILCRVGQTTWELVRLEQQDFRHISRLGITGHPAYYRLVPDGEGSTLNMLFAYNAQAYEVWPLPADGVEVIPVYEPDSA